MQTFARYGLAIDRLFDDESDVQLGTPMVARFPDWGLVWSAPDHVSPSMLREGLPVGATATAAGAAGPARLVLIPVLAARDGGTPVPGDLLRIRILSGAAAGRELRLGGDGCPETLCAATFDAARAGDYLWRLTASLARGRIGPADFCVRPAADPRACVIPYKGALELSRNPADASAVRFAAV